MTLYIVDMELEVKRILDEVSITSIHPVTRVVSATSEERARIRAIEAVKHDDLAAPPWDSRSIEVISCRQTERA